MSRALLVLSDQAEKAKAIGWITGAPVNTRVEFKRPKRSLDQNSKMWAMLTEVAQQVKWHGLTLHADDWKLIFLDALKREVRMVPNIDGNGFVSLGRSSSDLSKDEMSDLIELIFKFGSDPNHPVTFKDPPAESPSGGNGSASAPPSPGAGAADNSPATADEAGSQDMGESESEPVSNTLSDDDRAFLVRVFKGLKDCVGPHLGDFRQANLIFKDEISARSDLVKAKATTIREQLEKCCGENPSNGTVQAGKYVAGIIGVDEKELAA